MLNIRAAKRAEYEAVKDFYDSLIDSMGNSPFHPGWEKGIYPAYDYLLDSIKKGQLYCGWLEGQIVSCMIVNHEYNEGYRALKWSVNPPNSQLLVIHALGVDPRFSGRGIAREMARSVIALAKEQKIPTIRLDVLEGNIPAERAYRAVGFQYVGTVPMYYEDTGWTNYKAFELLLPVQKEATSMDDITIREYRPEDCPEITRLFYQTVHTVNARDYTEAQLDAWADGHPDLEAWNRSLLAHYSLVAIKDGRIAGFGDIDESGYLDRLYVHADYQKMGIASALCGLLEAAVPGALTTHASITARPFFEKRGYQVKREQQVERKGILLTNFVMEKSPSEAGAPDTADSRTALSPHTAPESC